MPIDFAWSIHDVCINIIARACTTFFYMPVEGGSYYVVASIHTPVCPSVDFSCPLHNSDTIRDIFKKLGTNVNHHQVMCREKER